MSDEHFLAAAIRNHIGSADNAPDRAILAVVDKCEAMRRNPSVGRWLADEFEILLVRELNAGIPYEHVDEFRRMSGL